MKSSNEPTLREHLSSAGKASAAKLTPEQRSARAKHAVSIREAKRKARTLPESDGESDPAIQTGENA